MAKFIHTANDILVRNFDTKMRGYDSMEVDKFLDEIIEDYRTYDRELMALKEENEQLKAQLERAERSDSVGVTASTQTVTNFDILKRLSNLEQEVFGDRLDN